MTRLAQFFWAIAAIDATLLVVFLVMTLQSSSGRNDGGREMGLFFFIALPGLVLVASMLTFYFSTSPIVRSIALFILLVPGLWFVKLQIQDKIIDRQVEANRLGTGYFDTEPMRQMGAAVVARDVETLLRVGPTVDVNARGRDKTLMSLAVSNADERISDGSELPVVRALLTLGANPNEAMQSACVRFDATLLEILLTAGANPNLLTAPKQPLIFAVMSSITPGSFRLLAKHGLDLNSRHYDDPLPIQLTIYRRWDLLAIAIELGANTGLARPDGRNVADELAIQVDEETKAGREIPADLLRARAALDASNKRNTSPAPQKQK
jgi:hypothetical protein